MILHLSYVACDWCGTSAQPGTDRGDARTIARGEGFIRRRVGEGRGARRRDLCHRCANNGWQQ